MLVYSVPARSIARNVGFQAQDIIREVNGVATNTAKDLAKAISLAESNPQAQWRLAIERNGQRIEQTL
jgi:S1-C subfamily serine protease